MANVLMIVAFVLSLVALSRAIVHIWLEAEARRSKSTRVESRKTLRRLIKTANSRRKEDMIKRSAALWGLDNSTTVDIMNLIDSSNKLKNDLGDELVTTLEIEAMQEVWGVREERRDYSPIEVTQALIRTSYLAVKRMALRIVSIVQRFTTTKLNFGGGEDGESIIF